MFFLEPNVYMFFERGHIFWNALCFFETRYVNASLYVFFYRNALCERVVICFFFSKRVMFLLKHVMWTCHMFFFRIASYVFFCMSKCVAFFFFMSERVVFFILLGFSQYFLFLDSSWYLGIPSTYFNFTRKISVCTNIST